MSAFPTAERLVITEIIIHPDYTLPSDNDIAVIKVSGTFNCGTDAILPACLPNKEVTAFLVQIIFHLFNNAEVHLR